MEKPKMEDHSAADVEDLLKQEDLWKTIDNELALRIKEDPVARQATLAVMLTAFQPKPAHLMLLGESAVGKSWLLANTIEFMPEENRMLLGSSTQRAWFYCGEPIMRPHPIIRDMQVIDYYRVDWRNKVVGILDNVSPRTIKDLKPIMSHDKEEIDMQITVQDGRWQTRRVRIIGCPSFINCSTWLKWDDELSSRNFCLTPRDSPQKYEAAAALLDELHKTGQLPTSSLAPRIHDAIRLLRDAKFRVVVSEPVIEYVRGQFKWNSGRDIRDYERILTLVESIGWMHSYQRERTQAGAVIADERDLEIVKSFSDELLKTSRAGTSGQVLDYYDRVLKPLAEDGNKSLGYDQIQQKYFDVYGRRIYRDTLILYNRELQDLGKIELLKDINDERRWVVRVL